MKIRNTTSKNSVSTVFRSPWPDVEAPTSSVYDAVLGAASKFGEKPAVIEGETGETLRYDQLLSRTERVAAGLALAGFQPGDRLAIALPSSIEFVLAWYGALRAGGSMVPINPLYTPAEIAFQIRDSGARFLLTTPDRAADMKGNVENLFVSGGNWNDVLECGASPPAVSAELNDIAALLYSSGTSGKQKGVMLTHFNMVVNNHQQAVIWPRADDVTVNVFPFYHVGGLNGMLNAFLRVGATLVLMRRFDLETFLDLSERYGATVLLVPPPVIVALTKSPLWNKFRLHRLRQAFSGAAPVGSEVQQAFERRTDLVLNQVWGMTEAACSITGCPNDGAHRKFGSCGYLLPSIEGQVVDVVTLEPLGAGKAGEIWIRGPNIMKGYWNHPEATGETLVGNGWMRTGDIGYFDSEGCIFLVDRLKELIKYNAQQVAPAELEDVIQSHPAVMDAAVIGAPDPIAGEIPKAFIVRKAGVALEPEELMAYVAARVAPHKKIRAVEFIAEIPKTPSGKILRRVLKESGGQV